MGQTLTEFIRDKVTDQALRDELLAELHWRGMDRDHGLIFEDSVEELDTPSREPKVGYRVQLRRSLKDKGRYQVTKVAGPKVTVVPMRMTADKRSWEVVPDADEQTFPADELMTVVTHTEKVYPGLISAGSVGPETTAPSHIAIRGENLHVLRALGYSHAAAVDLIYIDPPYNTGSKDWIYNDKRVDANDGYRHSKWLAFMHRRLELAKELLKDTGVIIVAIGDDEHHRLRMLMDDVFGEQNFISDVVWQGGRKNDSRHVSNGADYMLIYARDITSWSVAGYRVKDSPDVSGLLSCEISERGARWRTPKPGFEAVLEQGRRAWNEARLLAFRETMPHLAAEIEDLDRLAVSPDDSLDQVINNALDGQPDDVRRDFFAAAEKEGERLMRAYFRALPRDSQVRASFSRYNYFLPDGTLCRDDNITWPGGGGPSYDVLHPATLQPVPIPDRGWVYKDPDRMQEQIEQGWVIFREDHTKNISLKKPLEKTSGTVPLSVFERQRTHGTRQLYYPKDGVHRGVFTEQRFPNPKDVDVLQEWIEVSTPRDAVILDFFGGSGSTLDAVMRLNEASGGHRQCITATSNELSPEDESRLSAKGVAPGDAEWEAAGVFEYVLRPRIETVLTGIRPNGSTYDKALTGDHRVEFFHLGYMDDAGDLDTFIDYDLMAPLLWARAGATGPLPPRPDVGESVVGQRFAILFDTDQIKTLAKRVDANESIGTVFIVAGTEQSYRQAASDLTSRVSRRVQTIHLERTYLDSRTWIPRDRRRRAS